MTQKSNTIDSGHRYAGKKEPANTKGSKSKSSNSNKSGSLLTMTTIGVQCGNNKLPTTQGLNMTVPRVPFKILGGEMTFRKYVEKITDGFKSNSDELPSALGFAVNGIPKDAKWDGLGVLPTNLLTAAYEE